EWIEDEDRNERDSTYCSQHYWPVFRAWNLELLWSLELGCWSFPLFSSTLIAGKNRMAHHSKIPAVKDPTFTAKSRSTWNILRRVAVYLKPYKLMAAGMIACALFSLAFSLAYPKLTQHVIDNVIRDKRMSLLMPLMLGVVGAFLLRDFF